MCVCVHACVRTCERAFVCVCARACACVRAYAVRTSMQFVRCRKHSIQYGERIIIVIKSEDSILTHI